MPLSFLHSCAIHVVIVVFVVDRKQGAEEWVVYKALHANYEEVVKLHVLLNIVFGITDVLGAPISESGTNIGDRV